MEDLFISSAGVMKSLKFSGLVGSAQTNQSTFSHGKLRTFSPITKPSFCKIFFYISKL